MLNSIALGLGWSALYVLARFHSRPSLKTLPTLLPATLFRLSLPPIFGLLSALFSHTLHWPLFLLHPLLTLSIYLFFHTLSSLNQPPLQAKLSQLLLSSPFVRHYDTAAFSSTLLFTLLLLRA